MWRPSTRQEACRVGADRSYGLCPPEFLALGGERLGGVRRLVVSMEDGAFQAPASGCGLPEILDDQVGVRMSSGSAPAVRRGPCAADDGSQAKVPSTGRRQVRGVPPAQWGMSPDVPVVEGRCREITCEQVWGHLALAWSAMVVCTWRRRW